NKNEKEVFDMNTKTMEQFNQINTEVLENIEGGVPYGWYSPFSSISDNIICRNGYRYTMANMRNGNCRVDWSNVVGNVANNMAAAWGDLHNPLP
ncbi:bacteriocin class II family protein, partial [Streptococcus suis]